MHHIDAPRHSLFVRASRPLTKAFFRLLIHALSRVSITGFENVPPPGPYLVIFNHLAVADAALVVSFWPHMLEPLGAVQTLNTRLFGSIMRLYGTIPVQRDEFDRKVLDAALALLRAGRPIIISPEGGRSHVPGMRKARPGAAYLALKSSVPIVPVGVTGPEVLFDDWRPGRRRPMRMTVGKPFTLPALPLTGPERHRSLEEGTNILMRRIAELLPREYRGVYG